MTSEREHLKDDNSEKDKIWKTKKYYSEKETLENDNSEWETNLNSDKPEKEQTEKGQVWKGKSWKITV